VKVADWDSDMPPQEVLSLCLNVARGPVMWFGSAPRILDFANYIPRPDRILIWAPAFTLAKVGKDGYAYRYHPIALWRPVKQAAIFGDVIRVSCGRHSWWVHPGTKPIELMTPLVAASGGQSILDPFMGSGTTGVACAKLGRDFVGIELDPGYFDIAVKRIKAALAQPSLFGGENG
jgi:site-specific DNA-methyltransferase (adenine-specific)